MTQPKSNLTRMKQAIQKPPAKQAGLPPAPRKPREEKPKKKRQKPKRDAASRDKAKPRLPAGSRYLKKWNGVKWTVWLWIPSQPPDTDPMNELEFKVEADGSFRAEAECDDKYRAWLAAEATLATPAAGPLPGG